MTKGQTSRSLSGKVAIVTGGSRGIGRAIALRLARDGAAIALSYRINKMASDQTLRDIGSLGVEAIAIPADMAHLDDIATLFQEAQTQLGDVDILVNNAGTGRVAPIADVTEEDYDSIFAVNTRGVFFAMQQAARSLNDGGRIVNISSGITILGGPGVSVYAASKASVEQFTMAAARELGHRGITVNTVSAGLTDTDLLHEMVPKDVQERMAASSPFGRLGTADDIAAVVAYLVSQDAAWITGQNIRATGGMS
jgi:3-oxoacyl-[acyl-carrier protein] reductase